MLLPAQITPDAGVVELVLVNGEPAVSATEDVAEQVPLETVTVYVVEAVTAFAIGFAIVVLLRNVAGVHAYVNVPPLGRNAHASGVVMFVVNGLRPAGAEPTVPVAFSIPM